MSVKPRDRRCTDIQSRQEDKIRMNLSNIIDNINSNNLSHFYPKDESLFKRRIDKLNFKFYVETEKYLTNKNDMEKCQDALFIILFKQISLYIEEVERLNYLLKEKIEDEKSFKEKMEEFNKREREKSMAQVMINNLKSDKKTLERKLEEKNKLEDKLKNENESLHRQIKFYKDQLETNLVLRKSLESQLKKRKIFEEINSLNNLAGMSNSFISTSGNNILNDNYRSNSKDSVTKKVSININTNNNLESNSAGKTTMASYFSKNNLSTQNLNTQIQIVNSNTNNNLSELNTLSTTGSNFNISKILNKKRNYSDNNPSSNPKKSQIIGITNVSINNRYGNIEREAIHLANLGKISQGHSKNTFSPTTLLNNALSKTKSPEAKTSTNQVSSNSNNGGSNVSKNFMKSYKDFKIIKSIKMQSKKTESVEKLEKITNFDEKLAYGSNNSKNINASLNNFNNTSSNLSSLNLKSPKGGSTFINLHYDPVMNFTGNNQIILTNTNSNNTKCDSNFNSNIQCNTLNCPNKNPQILINSVNNSQSQTLQNLSSCLNNSQSFSMSSTNNENFLQDYILSSFNTIDNEYEYLNDLEKMLKNQKALLEIESTQFISNSEQFGCDIQEILDMNEKVDLSPSFNFHPSPLKDIAIRSESVENNRTYTLGNGYMLSDEECEGYKSANEKPAQSNGNKEQIKSTQYTTQSSQSNYSYKPVAGYKIKNKNSSNNLNLQNNIKVHSFSGASSVQNLNNYTTFNNINYVNTNSAMQGKGKVKTGLALVTIDLVNGSSIHEKSGEKNKIQVKAYSKEPKKKMDMNGYLNKLKNK